MHWTFQHSDGQYTTITAPTESEARALAMLARYGRPCCLKLPEPGTKSSFTYIGPYRGSGLTLTATS